uniref:RNase H type-1 domain-containing protein n=1 Tax=Myotis myotis TaxID=51298 RepID=A0A7J8AN36_MYOMY|nr:hypothetical protein mMyoMyo1_008002 [Myotis myotis]
MLFQTDVNWQIGLSGYSGELSCHLLKYKLLQFLYKTSIIIPKNTRQEPIPGTLTVFTDGSSNGKAAYHTINSDRVILTSHTSVQRIELEAIKAVLQDFQQPVNIISDSSYASGLVSRIETAQLKWFSDQSLFLLFKQVQQIVQQRKYPFYITHIRAHSILPSPLTKGNAHADQLVALLKEASESHQLLKIPTWKTKKGDDGEITCG